VLKSAVTSTEIEEESIDPSAHLSANTFLVPPLGEGEVHILVARLDEALVTDLQSLLSTDESERADRFVFPMLTLVDDIADYRTWLHRSSGTGGKIFSHSPVSFGARFRPKSIVH